MTADPVFADAQEMHRLHPDTFHAPAPDELAAIAPGDSVKVCTGDERFWVTVTDVTDTGLAGTVDNDLLFTDRHGLSYGDLIRFGRECVYDIVAGAVAKEAV